MRPQSQLHIQNPQLKFFENGHPSPMLSREGHATADYFYKPQKSQRKSPSLVSRRPRKRVSILGAPQPKPDTQILSKGLVKCHQLDNTHTDQISAQQDMARPKTTTEKTGVNILLNSKLNESSQYTLPTSSREVTGITVPEMHEKNAMNTLHCFMKTSNNLEVEPPQDYNYIPSKNTRRARSRQYSISKTNAVLSHQIVRQVIDKVEQKQLQAIKPSSLDSSFESFGLAEALPDIQLVEGTRRQPRNRKLTQTVMKKDDCDKNCI